jgi:hypothetical protein
MKTEAASMYGELTTTERWPRGYRRLVASGRMLRPTQRKGEARSFDPPRFVEVYEVAVVDDRGEIGRADNPRDIGRLLRFGRGWGSWGGTIRIVPTKIGPEVSASDVDRRLVMGFVPLREIDVVETHRTESNRAFRPVRRADVWR